MPINQQNESSPQDDLRARRDHLFSLIEHVTGGQKSLNSVQDLTVRAIKAEISRIEHRLYQYN